MGFRGVRRNAAKEQEWKERLREYAGSGLSIRAFCQEKGIPECRFYRWRRELAHREQEGRRRRPGTSASGASFSLVSWPPRDSAAGLAAGDVELVLENGRRVRVGREVDAERVREIVLALARP